MSKDRKDRNNERNRILRELDVPGLHRILEADGKRVPDHNSDGLPRDTVALAAIHKGRILWRDATPAQVLESQVWLRNNGFAVPVRGMFRYGN